MMPEPPYITIINSQETIRSWADSSDISANLREGVLRADFLIIPSKGYLDRPDLLFFPEGTENLFRFLRGLQNSAFRVEICVEEEEYRELALHADLLFIASTIVSNACVGVAVKLISEYIQRKLGSRRQETNVKWDLIIQDDKNDRSVKVSYFGPASEYNTVVSQAIKKLFEAQPNPQKRTRHLMQRSRWRYIKQAKKKR